MSDRTCLGAVGRWGERRGLGRCRYYLEEGYEGGVARELLWEGAPGGRWTLKLKSRRMHRLGRETGSGATN